MIDHRFSAPAAAQDHEDYRVEFTMDIPETWKTLTGEIKYLLKKAVEGLIPDNIIYRKKMGFGALMADWLRGDFGQQAEQAVLRFALLRRGHINVEHIKKLIDEHRSGRLDTSLYL